MMLSTKTMGVPFYVAYHPNHVITLMMPSITTAAPVGSLSARKQPNSINAQHLHKECAEYSSLHRATNVIHAHDMLIPKTMGAPVISLTVQQTWQHQGYVQLNSAGSGRVDTLMHSR